MAIRDTDLLRLSPDAQRQIFRKVQADLVEKERRKTQPKPKKSKYNNVKTIRNGIRFDSKKEADRYAEANSFQSGQVPLIWCGTLRT